MMNNAITIKKKHSQDHSYVGPNLCFFLGPRDVFKTHGEDWAFVLTL
jgi:hypothetical protein